MTTIRCKAIDPILITSCEEPAVATATQGGQTFYACHTHAAKAEAAGYVVTPLDRTDDPAPR